MEPIEVIDREEGKTDVRVHQLVKNLGGDVLSDSEVWHAYTIANGLIERMDLKESEECLAKTRLNTPPMAKMTDDKLHGSYAWPQVCNQATESR